MKLQGADVPKPAQNLLLPGAGINSVAGFIGSGGGDPCKEAGSSWGSSGK